MDFKDKFNYINIMIGKKPIFEPVDDLELDVVDEFTGKVEDVTFDCLELEEVDDGPLVELVGAAVVKDGLVAVVEVDATMVPVVVVVV